MRIIRESGYLREAEIDNRFQNQIAASKLEMRSQMQTLMDQTQTSVEAAIQQYSVASIGTQPAPAVEVNIQV